MVLSCSEEINAEIAEWTASNSILAVFIPGAFRPPNDDTGMRRCEIANTSSEADLRILFTEPISDSRTGGSELRNQEH